MFLKFRLYNSMLQEDLVDSHLNDKQNIFLMQDDLNQKLLYQSTQKVLSNFRFIILFSFDNNPLKQVET